jgi:hypothetical protein
MRGGESNVVKAYKNVKLKFFIANLTGKST